MAGTPTYNGTVQSIDTGLFDETVTAFRQAIESYRAAREAIFQITDKLTQNWEGEGKTSYDTVYRTLVTRLNDEEDNLRTIAEDFENMRQSYIDWDKEIASQFKR